MLLAAVNKEQITTALQIAGTNGMVAFATLDDKSMANFASAVQGDKEAVAAVYFYETG